MNDFPENPRFWFAKSWADKLLLHFGIQYLPFSMLAVLQHTKCHVYTYRQMSLVTRRSIDDIICDVRSKKGHAYKQGHEYFILYNSDRPIRGEVRWTLAHELGHIVLGHLDDYTAKQLAHISKEDYRTLEREANAFAAEFLAPASVLYAIGAKDAASIQSACMLSKEASSIREKLFQSIHEGYYLNATETRIVRRFDSFIHGVVA